MVRTTGVSLVDSAGARSRDATLGLSNARDCIRRLSGGSIPIGAYPFLISTLEGSANTSQTQGITLLHTGIFALLLVKDPQLLPNTENLPYHQCCKNIGSNVKSMSLYVFIIHVTSKGKKKTPVISNNASPLLTISDVNYGNIAGPNVSPGARRLATASARQSSVFVISLLPHHKGTDAFVM